MTDIYDLAGEPRPKFCINCKHIGRNGSGDASQYRCFAPANIQSKSPNLVTGLMMVQFRHDTCQVARLNFDGDKRCGPEGSWFEPKPTMEIVSLGNGQYTSRPIANDLLSQLEKM